MECLYILQSQATSEIMHMIHDHFFNHLAPKLINGFCLPLCELPHSIKKEAIYSEKAESTCLVHLTCAHVMFSTFKCTCFMFSTFNIYLTSAKLKINFLTLIPNIIQHVVHSKHVIFFFLRR